MSSKSIPKIDLFYLFNCSGGSRPSGVGGGGGGGHPDPVIRGGGGLQFFV